MSDEQLRAFRNRKVAELKERVAYVQAKKTANATIYPAIFFCTIYYTPRQSGFTAERGFDTAEVSAPGLAGRKFPRDFLEAVKKEGFGRITEPIHGCNYIRWTGDSRFTFAKAPVGRGGELLVPRHSCAISSRNKFLHQHGRLTIKSETVENEVGNEEWQVCDTGPGVHPLQIDLYWGEDEPRGAVGRQRARPKGTWMEYAFGVEVIERR